MTFFDIKKCSTDCNNYYKQTIIQTSFYASPMLQDCLMSLAEHPYLIFRSKLYLNKMENNFMLSQKQTQFKKKKTGCKMQKKLIP